MSKCDQEQPSKLLSAGRCMQHWLRQSLAVRGCRVRTPSWQAQLGIALRYVAACRLLVVHCLHCAFALRCECRLDVHKVQTATYGV